MSTPGADPQAPAQQQQEAPAQGDGKKQDTPHKFTESELESLVATMGELEFERQREELAKAQGVRVAYLEGLRKRTREAPAVAGQGRPVDFQDDPPWAQAVDGAELLEEITAEAKRFIVATEGAHEIIAAWSVFTHVHDRADVSTMLTFTSAVKRSGKTTALRFTGRLCYRPLPAGNVSPAAVFRGIEKYTPTLILDEVDTAFRDNDELRCLVNASHTRDAAYTLRAVSVGDNAFDVARFSTWCPKALALIGHLPPTLEDRSIIISMKRKSPEEKAVPLRAGKDYRFPELRRKIRRWTADNAEAIAAQDPEIPAELNDRSADNFRELLKVTDVAGGTWPEKLRRYAVLFSTAEDQDLRVRLLADIRDIFQVDAMPSATLADRLREIEGGPWAEYRKGKAVTPNQVAKLLAGFGVHSDQIKFEGRNLKGYRREDFQDAFARYLPPCPAKPRPPSEPLPDTDAVSSIDAAKDGSGNGSGSGCEGLPDGDGRGAVADAKGYRYQTDTGPEQGNLFQDKEIGDGDSKRYRVAVPAGGPGEGHTGLDGYWKNHDPDGADGGTPLY